MRFKVGDEVVIVDNSTGGWDEGVDGVITEWNDKHYSGSWSVLPRDKSLHGRRSANLGAWHRPSDLKHINNTPLKAEDFL